MDIAVLAHVLSSLATFVVVAGILYQGREAHGARRGRAVLRGPDLRGASVTTGDQIEWTIGSNVTRLPENLNRPELWSKSLEEQERIVREHIVGG